ncbi:3-isopropylmalate dehydratase small subunit [soil metagenome]
MTRSPLITTGRCWKFGDNLSSDELISAQHVFEYDPRMLRKHLLAEVRPELATTAKAGDVLVAGKRFAHGSQHSHPFIAMKDIGLGLIARTLTRPPYRLAVYMGVPLLEIGEASWQALNDGDELRVDYAQGLIDNLTTGAHAETDPLPGFLLDIVASGGGLGFLREQNESAGVT